MQGCKSGIFEVDGEDNVTLSDRFSFLCNENDTFRIRGYTGCILHKLQHNVTFARLLNSYSAAPITAPCKMIHGVVYSEFDNDAGPQIVFQAPEK